MKRFLTIIAATAVAAAVTIPAVADSQSPPDETLSCLRAHGIPVSAGLEGAAAKQWIGAHPGTPGLEDAFDHCAPEGPRQSGAGPEELRTCLAGKGLTPPASLDALKPWLMQQSQTAAGKATLNACGFAGVEEKHVAEGDGPCGADHPRASAASRKQRPKAQATPTS